jgi:hypothetical protein
MERDRKPADAAHAMTTALQHQQRAGRFGREIRGGDEPDGAGEDSATVGYVVDPEVVAEAIVARLVAGRTLPLAPPPR